MAEIRGLDALHDIVLPTPPPLWPPGDGFWAALLVLGVFVLVSWQWRRERRRRNAYRVAGLELLGQAQSVYDVSLALKRVALAAWPREKVAPLQGRDWVRFLNGTCRRCRFAEDALDRPDRAADPTLLREAERWIRGHGVGSLEQGGGA